MFKESVSMEITRLAKIYAAQGHKVYTLSIGDTHFTLPKTIQANFKNAIEKGYTHYLDSIGIKELRQSISEIEFKGEYKAEEILIVPGVKQGLYYFMKAFKGKKICILEPAWLGYHSVCAMCEKEIVRVNIKNSDWLSKIETLDFDALLLCCPNNPDGKIFNKNELETIHKIVTKKNAILIIDEIYSMYSFDADIKTILSPFYSQKNVVTVTGFSKGYAATGLRIGCIAVHDAEILKQMNIVHQNTATCANSLAQYAFINYQIAIPEAKEFAEYYRTNRDLICKLLPELEQFKPDGGFYYFINLEVFGIKNAEKFCKNLLEDKKIALVPGSAYGEGFENWLRLSFSMDRTQLTEAIQLFKNYISTYEQQ